MNVSNTSHQPAPIGGILSMILSPLGLLLVMYFASGAGTGVTHSRGVIVFAQYLLLTLLGSGLASGIAGVIRREQPGWLARTGLMLTIFITSLIALFFYSLDD
ncbi:MAG TPA: hypothetical protein VFR47_14970 [Anaerolineales bacterium]|nr:hypothetical protein [Anaerolineales bacterium]